MSRIVFDKRAYYSYRFTRDKQSPIDFITDKLFQFIYLEKGEFQAKYSRESLTVHAEELLFFSPVHKWEFIFGDCEEIQGMLFHFRDWPSVDELDFPPQVIQVDQQLKEEIAMLPMAKKEVDCAYIWKTHRFLTKVQTYMTRNDNKHLMQIERVLEYMRSHDHYTIPELVQLSGMKKSTFYLTFEKLLGSTPIEAKHRLQALKTELLLKSTELSIDDIAHQVGFNSPSHFRKVFGARYGFSPKEIRKRSSED